MTPGRRGRNRSPTSLLCRLEHVYATNPHGWHTLADLAALLSVPKEQVRDAINNLRQHGRMTIRSVTVYVRCDPD